MPNATMTVRDVYEQVNSGVIRTNIELQREIIYDVERQCLVIDSLVKGIPLPAFYFWDDGETLEVLDGKQRIHAISEFLHNNIEYDGLIYMRTAPDTQRKILDTELTCIICSGEDATKREIFRRINTLGIALSNYEVLNGLYHGQYLRGVTKYVSQDKKAAKVLGKPARGRRQMTALKLLMRLKNSPSNFTSISSYVEEHQGESFANDQHRLNRYINFVADIFTDPTPLDPLFDIAIEHIGDKPLWARHKAEINTAIKRYKKTTDWKLRTSHQERTSDLEALTVAAVGDIRLDPRRTFTPEQKAELLSHREGKNRKYQCDGCGQWFYPDELETDHVLAWSRGGRTELSNAQLLCRVCNLDKSSS